MFQETIIPQRTHLRADASFVLGVLGANKFLLVFPILSLLIVLVLAGVLVVFPAVTLWERSAEQWTGAMIGVSALSFAAVIFLTIFVAVFLNVALVACALQIVRGEPATFASGIQLAGKRLPQIIGWAFITFFVGMLFHLLENTHRFVVVITAFILGAAWTVMTFLVLPCILVEGLGPFAAIRRSKELIQATWGDGGSLRSLRRAWSYGKVWMLCVLLPTLIVGAAFYFAWNLHKQALEVGIGGLAVAMFASLGVLGSALSALFRSVLYVYAAEGKPPAGVTPETMQGAFGSRSNIPMPL